MAKGKSQYATWYCVDCNKANYHSYYCKRRDSEIVKEKQKYCSVCKKQLSHKRKDTKKGN